MLLCLDPKGKAADVVLLCLTPSESSRPGCSVCLDPKVRAQMRYCCVWTQSESNRCGLAVSGPNMKRVSSKRVLVVLEPNVEAAASPTVARDASCSEAGLKS